METGTEQIPEAHGALAQLVEHIVHIDGVTGSSPVSTTMKKALISLRNRGFFFYAFEICAQNSRGVVLSFPAVIIKK